MLRVGLESAGHDVAATLASPLELLRAVEAVKPDIIIIDTESPNRDVLEHVVLITRDQPRPIVMFTEDGDQASIEQLARAVGFRYAYDPTTGLYAHASGIMILTPQGKLARYFYGIEYAPKDLRLGLVEASAGKIGSPVDQLLLYCYHYDPASGKYGAVVMNMIRLGGVATVIAIIAMFIVFRMRGLSATRASAGGIV